MIRVGWGLLCATDLEKPEHNTSLGRQLQPMAADGDRQRGGEGGLGGWGVA